MRVTQRDAAIHLDISTRRYQELVSWGILPSHPRERVDLEEARVAYLRYLRSRAEARGINPVDGQRLR